MHTYKIIYKSGAVETFTARDVEFVGTGWQITPADNLITIPVYITGTTIYNIERID